MRRIRIVYLIAWAWMVSATVPSVASQCISRIQLDDSFSGETLVYRILTDSGEQQIWLYDLDSEQPSFSGIVLRGTTPVLSPEGDSIAYLAEEQLDGNNQSVLRILNLTMGDLHSSLVGSYAEFRNLHWTNDNQVTFAQFAESEIITFTADVNGGVEIRRTPLPEPFDGESWWYELSPNSEIAAYFELKRFNVPIQFINLQGGAAFYPPHSELILGDSTPRDLQWDGNRRLLFMDHELNWHAYDLDTDVLEQLTELGSLYYLRSPIVSPDKLTTVYDVYSPPQWQDHRMGIIQGDSLVLECESQLNAQFRLDAVGWDDSSMLFAYVSYHYGDDGPLYDLLILDRYQNQIINLLEDVRYPIDILGWR